MQFDSVRVFPYVFALLAVLLVFRRLRRSFGRQALRPVRMRIRIGLLTVLACFLVPVAASSGRLLLTELCGASAGIALGVWGAKHTRYQIVEGQLNYIPHTYAGIAVSLLFVGRLAYRIVETNFLDRASAGTSASLLMTFGQSKPFSSPMTVALLSVVIGYYVCYYGWVLRKSQRISPEDLEAAPAPNAAAS